MSEQGAFVHTSTMLPLNGEVDLHLPLPGGSRVAIPSRVAHCLPPERADRMGRRAGIGFNFLDTPGEAAPALDALLRSAQEDGRDSVYTRECSVLVMAKDQAVRGRMRRVLAAGFAVVQLADSSARARYLFESRAWDLVIVDESMGDWELIRHCAEDDMALATPLIYVATAVGTADRFRAQCMGAREVLSRPFFDSELMLRATHLVGARRPDFAGDLSSVGAASAMSLLAFEKRTGVLTCHGPLCAIRVGIRAGAIAYVHGPEGLTHLGQVLEALDWKHGRFEFRACDVAADGGPVTELSAVLMQHARMQDEGSESQI